MRLLGIDIETTGLEIEKERILEIGVSLHEDNDSVYLHQASWLIFDEDIKARLPLSEEIKSLTGIRDEALSEFGCGPFTAYSELERYCVDHRVDYLVAHNGENFDRPFILHELDKFKILGGRFREIPWIDTRRDIVYDGKEPKWKSLDYLLMKKRFVPSIAHRALSDAENTMWLLSHYDLSAILERHKIPWVIVSLQVHYDDRALAKENGYSWQELNYRTYSKKWVKLIKENEIKLEEAKFPSHVVQVLR